MASADVAGLDFLDSFEVRHRPGYAQDAIVGSRRKAQAHNRVFHLLLRFGIEFAEAADQAR